MKKGRLAIVLILVLLCFVSSKAIGQTVGVVLSGGGAMGTAHIGFLRSLEQNNIPIDYIAGTSMGALVGGLYAMGYTPDDIEKALSTPEFQKMVSGKIDNKYVSFYRKPPDDAGWIGLEFNIDSIIKPIIPVNLVSTTAMDYTLMEVTAAINKQIQGDFDRLFVPFRCVAADIYNKQEVVFKGGDLGQALRASATYPFYFKPISINGVLLYDGGLYNNFPANVVYNDFLPDVIIGCTVAKENLPPEEDNIYSQVKNMLMYRQSYSEVCETNSMIIIRPQIERRTILDFKNIKVLTDEGFHSTEERMEEIKQMVERRRPKSETDSLRKVFRSKISPPKQTVLKFDNLSKNQSAFVRQIFGNKPIKSDWSGFKRSFYRFTLDEAVQSVYPRFIIGTNGNADTISLLVKLRKKWETNFGGLISSNPINTGFASINYRFTGRVATKLEANTYFGKFYSSVLLRSNLYYPWIVPVSLDVSAVYNSFNFFNSQTSFFELVKPSYLIQYERLINATLNFPTGAKGKLGVGINLVNMSDEYYQTTNFGPGDTADITRFNHFSLMGQYDYNTLNYKFYPNRGHRVFASFRNIDGREVHDPGSTTANKDVFRKTHEFFRARFRYENYIGITKFVSIGVLGEAVYSNQPFFNNYTSTILQAPSFLPIPEMQTVFLDRYRAHSFAAAGVRSVFSVGNNFDIRAEAYAFQPYRAILNQNGSAEYADPVNKRFFGLSGVLVYRSPITPLALSVNYFDRNNSPWSVMFTMGYLIFNKRAFD